MIFELLCHSVFRILALAASGKFIIALTHEISKRCTLCMQLRTVHAMDPRDEL